jgi:hypothetical protein
MPERAARAQSQVNTEGRKTENRRPAAFVDAPSV